MKLPPELKWLPMTPRHFGGQRINKKRAKAPLSLKLDAELVDRFRRLPGPYSLHFERAMRFYLQTFERWMEHEGLTWEDLVDEEEDYGQRTD